jgi:hypothetical protein
MLRTASRGCAFGHRYSKVCAAVNRSRSQETVDCTSAEWTLRRLWWMSCRSLPGTEPSTPPSLRMAAPDGLASPDRSFGRGTTLWFSRIAPVSAGVIFRYSRESSRARRRMNGRGRRPSRKQTCTGPNGMSVLCCWLNQSMRANKKRDEFAPSHSITLSAIASSVRGTVRPSVFAVLRLITSSSSVACTTGSQRVFRPFAKRFIRSSC